VVAAKGDDVKPLERPVVSVSGVWPRKPSAAGNCGAEFLKNGYGWRGMSTGFGVDEHRNPLPGTGFAAPTSTWTWWYGGSRYMSRTSASRRRSAPGGAVHATVSSS